MTVFTIQGHLVELSENVLFFCLYIFIKYFCFKDKRYYFGVLNLI